MIFYEGTIYGIVLEMVIRIKNKNTSNIPIPNHTSDLQILQTGNFIEMKKKLAIQKFVHKSALRVPGMYSLEPGFSESV